MIFLRKVKLPVPVFFLFLLALFTALWIPRLRYISQTGRLTEEILSSADFRSQPVSDEMMRFVKSWDSPGEAAGLSGWKAISSGRRRICPWKI